MDRQMGAVLLPETNSCQFNVWAPNAEAVFVIGDFNQWSTEANPLNPEEGGIWSATIEHAKEGNEYKYRILYQGNELIRNDPYARNVTHSAGNSIIARPPQKRESDFQAPDLNYLVIYELHIGTFGRGKVEKGIPATFKSSIAYLDDLQALGVNAIEIMPIHEFPGGISWGYNPAHLFSVETDYGTAEDFYEFVEQAHQRGMAVILDVVYNHFGPNDLDIWQFDGWNENGMGGIYFYNDWRSKTPWGDTRPDYGRSEVKKYIIDNALMWAKDFNVDGLRLDMAVYIRTVNGVCGDAGNELKEGWHLMQEINRAVHEHNPRFITIAEDMQDSEWLTKKDFEQGGAGFNSQWSAFFVHTLRAALLQPDDANRDMLQVTAALTQCFNGDAFERVIYTESHDEIANGQARIPEEASPGSADSWMGKKKSILGSGIVFTAPGIPMIFQGQEFLEDRWFEDTRKLDRDKAEYHAGVLQAYKDLISLRLNKQQTTAGLGGQYIHVFNVDNDNKVLAYHRWQKGGPGDSVVVVANFSHQSFPEYRLGLPCAGEWLVRFNSNSQDYDPEFDNFGSEAVNAQNQAFNELPACGVIALPAYSLLILSQN